MRVLKDNYGRTWTDEDEKKCCRCKETLPVTAFGGKTKIADYCKPCARIVNSTYAENNRDKIRASNNAAAARRYEKNCKLLDEYLADKCCVDCSEADPVVLEFDHVDPETKVYQIGDMLGSHCWETILAEIAKCVIRCANCHRRRTALQRGWRAKGGGAL